MSSSREEESGGEGEICAALQRNYPEGTNLRISRRMSKAWKAKHEFCV
jgi:hypothetical protein